MRPTILEDLATVATEAFGNENIRVDSYTPKQERNEFWILTEDGSVESSLKVSEVIATLPPAEFGLLFVSPGLKDKAKRLVDGKLKAFLNEDDSDYCI